MRGLVKTSAGMVLQKALEQYLPKMLAHLQKPREFDDLFQALINGKIYRPTTSKKKTEPPPSKETLPKALQRHISWSIDSRHRLLTFLRLFKCNIALVSDCAFVAKDSKKRVELPPEAPTAELQAAREALREHGAAMRLLELFYQEFKVRLVIFQGATCRYVHTPRRP